MLRGELALAALVILGLITLYDVFTGHTESLSTFGTIALVSAFLTGVGYLFRRN